MVLTCPWGNTFYIYQASMHPELDGITVEAASDIALKHNDSIPMDVNGGPGIRFVELRSPDPSAVADFYSKVMDCHITSAQTSEEDIPAVCVGPDVHLLLTEGEVTPEEQRASEGVHVCIYVTHFQRLHGWLRSRRALFNNPRAKDTCDTYTRAKACRQLRFKDIIAPGKQRKVAVLEHEARAMGHSQFMKEVVYNPI